MEELTRATIYNRPLRLLILSAGRPSRRHWEGKSRVSCFAGHSLGEYSALFAAGVMSVEDTMRLVSKRGALMEREGKIHPGGMRAVLGLDIKTIEELISNYRGPGAVTAANHNTPAQVVISGSMDAMNEISRSAEAQGAKVIALNVSVANHSPLVADAVPDFAEFMADIPFQPPQIPVYFNVSAAKETDTRSIKKMMASQIATRVRWYEIIEAMLADGVDTFIEVGPKTVLTGMMRKIVPKGTKVTALQCDNPASLAECVKKITT